VSVTGEGGHGGGRYSQLLRVGSSSLKRGLIEPAQVPASPRVGGRLCGLVSRSGLCGGGPLVAAASARPPLRRGLLRRGVSLLGTEPLTLHGRAGLLCVPARHDTELVNGGLGPRLLLAVLLVRAGRLAAN